MSTSKLMLCPTTSLEKIKTYSSWKQCISCKVNVLLPELKNCPDEYHCPIKSECVLKKTDNERILESVRNSTSVVFNPLSKINIDSFINCLSSQYSQINCVAISCEYLKIIFRKLYFEYENVLPIFPEVILPVKFSYLFLPERELKKKSEYLFHENSNNFITKLKVKEFLSDERKKGFKYSYILNREDEMQIKLAACKHTVNWITNTDEIPDLHDWRDFHQQYTVNKNDLSSNSFNYSKQDYIDIAISLQFILFESLLICPCQDTFDNMFWNHFDCSPPFKHLLILLL